MLNTSMSGSTVVVLLIMALVVVIFLRRLLVRLLYTLLENPVGRTVLGILLCVGGLIFGFTSYFAPYQTLSQSSVNLLVPHINTLDDGNVYVQDLSNVGTFYIIHVADFSPQVNASDFQNGIRFTSLIYDGNTTQRITNSFGAFARIDAGTGYMVKQFSLNGSVFMTADYRTTPYGLYQNHWLIGGGIACAGLVLLFVSFGIPFLSKRWEKASATNLYMK